MAKKAVKKVVKRTAKKEPKAAQRPPKLHKAVRRNRVGGPSPNSPPILLTGGNPQIAKGDGDAPVQAYIAAMPGWKRDVGRHLDALIERAVPGVRKAVKWNSPFYGMPDRGWFLGVHCVTKYVKVAFFRGTSLLPIPPVESKNDGTRYLHIHEGEAIDEARFVDWVRQAAALPGAFCGGR
jgi:hypothetical protein